MSNIKIGDKVYNGVDTVNVKNADTDGSYVSFVLPTPLQEKTATPTTTVQEITPDSGYALSKVTVNAVTSAIDSNIVAENIKSGVSILGVAGTLTKDNPIIDIATTAEMNAMLNEANVGKVYRFTGTTDSTFTNGDLYEVVTG